MTVINQDYKTSYAADGVATEFHFNFKTLDSTWIKCFVSSPSGSAPVELTDFTVTLNADQELMGGGVVNFLSPPSEGDLAIVRDVPITQLLDYKPYDPFPAESHEDALDKITFLIQRSYGEISNAVMYGEVTDPSDAVPARIERFSGENKYLRWREDGVIEAVVAQGTEIIARVRDPRQLASQGQTVFNTAAITLFPNTNATTVLVNGVAQVEGIDYSATSNSITFVQGLDVNDAVDIYSGEVSNAAAITEGVKSFATVQDLKNSTLVGIGDQVQIASYTSTNNSGTMFGEIVAAGTGVDDGGSYIDLPASDLQFKQNLPYKVDPKMWGAEFNGTNDDSVACQSAVNYVSDGSTIVFPYGVCTLEAPISFNGKNNITIESAGCTVQSGAIRIQSLFDLSGSDGCHVKGFEFDQRKTDMPLYGGSDYPNLYNVPVYMSIGGAFTVSDCRFYNLYTTGIKAHQFTKAKVYNCEFESPSQSQGYSLEHINAVTGGELDVYNNRFVNASVGSPYAACGVVFSGISARTLIDNNYFDYCGRDNTDTHRLGVIDLYYDAKNVTVTNNVAVNCLAQFMRLSTCNGGLVANNRAYASGSAEPAYTMLSIEGYHTPSGNKGTHNVTIRDNLLSDPHNRHEIAIGVFGYDWGVPTESVKVINNTIVGAKEGVYVNGAYDGIDIHGNKLSGYSSKIRYTLGAMTSTYGSENTALMDRLSIKDNMLETETAAVPIDIDTQKTPDFEGQVRNVQIHDNTMIRRVGAIPPTAINIKTKALSRTADVSIKNNLIEGYAKGIDAGWIARLSVKDNVVKGLTAGFLSAGATVDYVESRFNTVAGGKVSGTAVLSGGSVVVGTGEIKTGDKVLLQAVATGGTIGFLYVNSITDGASFEIKSTSASESSTVFWEIIH